MIDAGTFIKTLISCFLAAILTENYILAKFLGICPFLGVSKKLNTAVGMSAAVIFVMVLATAVTWPLYTFVLTPLGIDYLETIAFILVIAFLVQLLETAMKKFMPPLYNALGIFLPLITTNCAVLGVALVNVQKGYGFLMSVLNGVAGGLGFLVAIVLFASLRERVEKADCPESFRGYPITLIAAGLLALAFMGFSGLKIG